MPPGGAPFVRSVMQEYNAPTQAPRLPSQYSGFGSNLKTINSFQIYVSVKPVRCNQFKNQMSGHRTKTFPAYQTLLPPPSIRRRDSIRLQSTVIESAIRCSLNFSISTSSRPFFVY